MAVMSASLWRKLTAGPSIARDKIFFGDFQNIFLDFTSIFGLQTIFVFVKNLFVDPIILLGFVIRIVWVQQSS